MTHCFPGYRPHIWVKLMIDLPFNFHTREQKQGFLLQISSGGKNNSSSHCLAWRKEAKKKRKKKSFLCLLSSCITDPLRRQALGAVEVQPGAAFLPRMAQVQKSARNPRNCMRVLGLLP